jgi:hypothetical protein
VQRRVLVALAVRDSDAAPEIQAALGRIQRAARRLPLARLDQSEVAKLVGECGDSQRVFELSEGNPLFVEELLASLQSEGALRLPALSSVREVIRERLATLPEPSLAALVAASVVGRDFRGHVIAHMLSTDDVGKRLQPVLVLRMVTMTSPDRYRFSHALVTEAIAAELEPSERARLHLRAARALERYEPGDSAAIAHHLLAAGHLAAEAAVEAAERAAQQCMAQLAFEDAAAMLERALQALLLAAPLDRLRRAQLLCARAEALQHATRHAVAAELCDEAAALTRALAAATPPGDHAELLARIALTRGLEFRFGRTDPLLVSLLREALDTLGSRASPQRARLLARLAAAEQPAPDPREPLAMALESIDLAAQLDPRDRMDVMYVASAALIDYLDPVALERIQLEVLALARGTDRSISVHTRLRLCFIALDRVDRPAFDIAVRAFADEAAALGLVRWTRQIHMLEAMTAQLEGRFDDAERAAERFESMSIALGDTGAGFVLDVHRAMSAWVRTAPIAAAVRAHVADYAPGRAAISAWLGVLDAAPEATRSALAQLGGRIPLDPDMAAMMASAVAFVGDAAFAAEVYDVLAARSGRIVVASMVGSSVMDIYDRLLLTLAAAAQRWDVIDAHATRALAIAAQLGSPVWIARVQADWADALERRGHTGDAQRAHALWAQALLDAQRLGMPGLTARCRVARPPESEHEPQASAPPASDRAHDPIAFERRGGLWIVRGFGEQVHVKDSRGMQLLARLVAEAGRELHVLELMGSAGAASGDAGPLLDAQARTSYRTRLSELTVERDEAECSGDLGRLERAQAEIEALSAELERAFGLGGRERKAGAASERARSNCQRRIAHAIDQIRAASARLGEHLVASVRTGTYCAYSPGNTTSS